MNFRAAPIVSGSVLILDMSGTLEFVGDSAEFRDAGRKYLDEAHYRILLDMEMKAR